MLKLTFSYTGFMKGVDQNVGMLIRGTDVLQCSRYTDGQIYFADLITV